MCRNLSAESSAAIKSNWVGASSKQYDVKLYLFTVGPVHILPSSTEAQAIMLLTSLWTGG